MTHDVSNILKVCMHAVLAVFLRQRKLQLHPLLRRGSSKVLATSLFDGWLKRFVDLQLYLSLMITLLVGLSQPV